MYAAPVLVRIDSESECIRLSEMIHWNSEAVLSWKSALLSGTVRFLLMFRACFGV
jgi:hypothetical protein